MATELSKGNLFNPELSTDLMNKVKGKSSLAALSNQEPIPFNGITEFTFSLDNEIDIVAENGKKTHGGATIEAKTIVPIKVEYGARVSDEFMYGSEAVAMNIMKSFNDGFAKKVAKGFDIMGFHGVNPRNGLASSVIGTNHFDSEVSQTVTFVKADIEKNIEAGIALIEGSEGEVSGMAISPTARQALASLETSSGGRLYPELIFGKKVDSLNGLPIDVNKTVSYNNVDEVIVGDFESMFKWGYAKEIPTKVIEYGDPDNSGKDLQGYNQVYIRAEVYLGWGILDPDSFARVVA